MHINPIWSAVMLLFDQAYLSSNSFIIMPFSLLVIMAAVLFSSGVLLQANSLKSDIFI